VAEQLVLENGRGCESLLTESNTQDRGHSAEHSVVPMEYAFHLLGDAGDKTLLTLASGDTAWSTLSGFNAGAVDHVLCIGIMRQVDPIVLARNIRRVLKPGGAAVFSERLDNRAFIEFKKIRREADHTTSAIERTLTVEDVDAVCRAVGRAGRRREFWLATPLIHRMGFGIDSKLMTIFQRADAALLRRFLFARRLAHHLIWEARKES
jgi:hypothetical protein